MPFYAIQFSDDGRKLTAEEAWREDGNEPQTDANNRLLLWVTPNIIKDWAREILGREPTSEELEEIVHEYQDREDDEHDAVGYIVQDLIDRGRIDDGEDDELEICNECGEEVSKGSGKFVNRVIDLSDTSTRREMGKPYPKGAYMCADCEAQLRDDAYSENAINS